VLIRLIVNNARSNEHMQQSRRFDRLYPRLDVGRFDKSYPRLDGRAVDVQRVRMPENLIGTSLHITAGA
jgi:hypothetical protein